MNRRASDPPDSDHRQDRNSPSASLNDSAKWIAALVGLVLLLLGGFGGLTIAGWTQLTKNSTAVAVLAERADQTDRRLEEHYQSLIRALDEIKDDLRNK